MEILSKDLLLSIGKNLESMEYEAINSRYIDSNTLEPFNGVGYLLCDDDSIDSYAYFKNGIMHGEAVEFFEGYRPREWYENYRGIGQGGYKVWDEHGNLLFDGVLDAGVIIKFKQWDEEGNIIGEKIEASEEDIEKIKRIKSLWPPESGK